VDAAIAGTAADVTVVTDMAIARSIVANTFAIVLAVVADTVVADIVVTDIFITDIVLSLLT
jgi:hypothetical protein